MCVTAFFEDVPDDEYAVNRTIDRKVRAFSWDDLEGLLRLADVPRRSHLMRAALNTVRQAQADWPALLAEAPGSMRRAVTGRLAGGVALARP